MNHAGTTPVLLGRLLAALPSAALRGLATLAIDVPLGLIVLAVVLVLLAVAGSVASRGRTEP
jgi:hypothetical protein